jgi:serine protease
MGLLAGAAITCASPAATAAPATRSAAEGPPVRGLIVQLKDGATDATTRSATAATARTASTELPQALRRVLSASRLAASRARPVGRSAHLVEFDRPLAAAEAQAMAATLRANPEVAWVVPNERERRLAAPNDPYFAATPSAPGQWWLFANGGSNANALADRRRGVPGFQTAWNRQLGNAAAVVAVLDTGITAHPDLSGHVLPGHDFVSSLEVANDGDGRDADPSDPGDWVSQADKDGNPVFAGCDVGNSSWHGTVIGGIVAAVTDNAQGAAATSWDGRVLPVRVAGKCGADVNDIVDGMRWAAGLPVAGAPANPHPARVVTVSFGGSAACNPAYQSAIDELTAAGVVLVAAAGNEQGAVTRPANCRGVVAVAALNRDGFKASYSNFGTAVTISTVGGDPRDEGAWGPALGDDGVVTLDNTGLQGPGSPAYARVFGTSFAAPITAGVVALMLSENPSLTAAQIVDGLRVTARPHVVSARIGACSAANPGRCICTTATCGAGILDAEQAVQYAANPAAYVAPARQPAAIDNADVDAAVALGQDVGSPAPAPVTGTGGGGGGGALRADMLLALALAAWALRRVRAQRPLRRGGRRR